jgi:hypothetical protein
MKDLKQEEINGRRRVENPIAPSVLGLAAGFFNHLSRQSGSDILAQSDEDRVDPKCHRSGSIRTSKGTGVFLTASEVLLTVEKTPVPLSAP